MGRCAAVLRALRRAAEPPDQPWTALLLSVTCADDAVELLARTIAHMHRHSPPPRRRLWQADVAPRRAEKILRTGFI